MRKINLIHVVMGMLALTMILVCLKFPVYGIFLLEKKHDRYPILSQQTVVLIDQMQASLFAFENACKEGDDLNASVARRKELARQANFGLLKTIVLGTQAYTHSTWWCADPEYQTPGLVAIHISFVPTY